MLGGGARQDGVVSLPHHAAAEVRVPHGGPGQSAEHGRQAGPHSEPRTIPDHRSKGVTL